MSVYTITKKNQTTVPNYILEVLGLKPGDKIGYEVSQDNQVKLINPSESIKKIRGSVTLPKKYKGLEIDEIIDLAKKDHFKNTKKL
jgi:bifunctional DNA-binding transcriptional regulator/antitoxin component of YhaV-PrlF toxin-antitoxin module